MNALISAENFSEVAGKLLDAGVADVTVEEMLENLWLDVVPFEIGDAYDAGRMRPLVRQYGLSLGDRACIALARTRKRPVLTADGSRTKATLPVEVIAIL